MHLLYDHFMPLADQTESMKPKYVFHSGSLGQVALQLKLAKGKIFTGTLTKLFNIAGILMSTVEFTLNEISIMNIVKVA